jgi:hypothetical protein
MLESPPDWGKPMTKICAALVRLVLLLTLLPMATGPAVPAHAQSADRAADLRRAQAVRHSIQQHWVVNADPKLDGMRGTASFEVDTEGRLVGRPEVKLTGGTAAQRALVARNVQAIIQRASPFAGPSGITFPEVTKFKFSFQFDGDASRNLLRKGK